MVFLISFQQICIMFILMGIGFFCRKKGMIHEETSKDLTSLLIWIVSPCLIINSFERKVTPSLIKNFWLVIIAGICIYLFPIIFANIFVKHSKFKDDPDKNLIAFGTAYNNCGFIGIPLIQAIMGSQGTFFAVPILAVNNLFMWTHGISAFQKKQPISDTARKIFTNPNIIATIIGFILFITGISTHLFPILKDSISYVAQLNTPLSMIVIGSNLGAIKGDFYKDGKAWLVTFFRNVLMPFCLIFILLLIPMSKTAYLSCIIMASAPVAGFIVMLSLMANRPVAFPMRVLCLSTVSSLVTVPAMIMLANIIKNLL